MDHIKASSLQVPAEIETSVGVPAEGEVFVLYSGTSGDLPGRFRFDVLPWTTRLQQARITFFLERDEAEEVMNIIGNALNDEGDLAAKLAEHD